MLPPGLRLRAQLSGAKAWIEAGDLSVGAGLTQAGRTLTLTVTLDATEKQAVVDYNAAKLDGGYVTAAPVLRCLLRRSADYPALAPLALSSQILHSVQYELRWLFRTSRIAWCWKTTWADSTLKSRFCPSDRCR